MKTNLHILANHKIPDAILASGSEHALLLLRDAVYILLRSLPTELKNMKVYVLEEDLVARGIPKTNIKSDIELIDYPRFVDLIVEYKTSTSW